MDSRLLLKALLDRGVATAEAVSTALEKPGYAGRPLEWVLVDEGVIEEETLLQTMSEVYGLPLISLTPEMLDASLATQLPINLLREHGVYPLRALDGSDTLPLATMDPFNVLSEDAIHQFTGRPIRLVLASRDQIHAAIEGKLLSSEGFQLLVDQVPDLEGLDGLSDWLQAEGPELTENDAPIIKLVNSILRDAIRRGASDIHIEPRETSFQVRYRLDGLLRPIVEMPKRAERTCISRVKIMSGLDISESRKPQDGRLSLRVGSNKVNMRVSSIPSAHGEKIVLRILDENAVQLDLTRLGLSPAGLSTLRTHLDSSSGMILITGPTGSGKTSTLYAALRLLNKPTVNIVTVEDPIEFQVPGLNQVAVHAKAGITFASALRAFLRQDPDIIMVGEIRDLETVETAIQAAQTGHLVFSTLHTNDAPGTLSRLVLMGAEAHAIADSLLCVMAQRLVRRLCPECRQPSAARPEQSTLLSLAVERPQLQRCFLGVGCESCDDTGYRGRMGLYEILTVTSSIRQQMLLDPSEHALWQVARSEGMQTLLEDGLAKVEAGETSLDEVLRVVTVRRRPTRSQSLAEPNLRISGTPGAPAADAVGPRQRSVREIMAAKVLTVAPDALISEAVALLAQKGWTGCPVVTHQGKLLGVLSLTDVVAADRLRKTGRRAEFVREIMSQRTVTIEPEQTLDVAAQMLRRHRIHRLVVVDQGAVVGVVTPTDLIDSFF